MKEMAELDWVEDGWSEGREGGERAKLKMQ